MCGPANSNVRRAGAMKLAFPSEGVDRNNRNLKSWKVAATAGAKRTAKPAARVAEEETNRSVSFSASCKVVLVLCRAEMTGDEVLSTWYSGLDKKEIEEDNVRIIRAIRKKNKLNNNNESPFENSNDDDELCSRGLEALLCPKLLGQLKTAKDLVVSAVLQEQDEQRRHSKVGIMYDPEELRKSSMRASAAAVDLALSYAKADAALVRRGQSDAAGDATAKLVDPQPCRSKRALSLAEELCARHARGAPKKKKAASKTNLVETLEAALQTVNAEAFEPWGESHFPASVSGRGRDLMNPNCRVEQQPLSRLRRSIARLQNQQAREMAFQNAKLIQITK